MAFSCPSRFPRTPLQGAASRTTRRRNFRGITRRDGTPIQLVPSRRHNSKHARDYLRHPKARGVHRHALPARSPSESGTLLRIEVRTRTSRKRASADSKHRFGPSLSCSAEDALSKSSDGVRHRITLGGAGKHIGGATSLGSDVSRHRAEVDPAFPQGREERGCFWKTKSGLALLATSALRPLPGHIFRVWQVVPLYRPKRLNRERTFTRIRRFAHVIVTLATFFRLQRLKAGRCFAPRRYSRSFVSNCPGPSA